MPLIWETMEKKKNILVAKICVIFCLIANIVNIIISGISIIRIVGIIFSIIALVCFLIEEKRMSK